MLKLTKFSHIPLRPLQQGASKWMCRWASKIKSKRPKSHRARSILAHTPSPNWLNKFSFEDSSLSSSSKASNKTIHHTTLRIFSTSLKIKASRSSTSSKSNSLLSTTAGLPSYSWTSIQQTTSSTASPCPKTTAKASLSARMDSTPRNTSKSTRRSTRSVISDGGAKSWAGIR